MARLALESETADVVSAADSRAGAARMADFGRLLANEELGKEGRVSGGGTLAIASHRTHVNKERRRLLPTNDVGAGRAFFSAGDWCTTGRRRSAHRVSEFLDRGSLLGSDVHLDAAAHRHLTCGIESIPVRACTMNLTRSASARRSSWSVYTGC